MFQYFEHQWCWFKTKNNVEEIVSNDLREIQRNVQPFSRYWGSKDAPKAAIPLGPGNSDRCEKPWNLKMKPDAITCDMIH